MFGIPGQPQAKLKARSFAGCGRKAHKIDSRYRQCLRQSVIPQLVRRKFYNCQTKVSASLVSHVFQGNSTRLAGTPFAYWAGEPLTLKGAPTWDAAAMRSRASPFNPLRVNVRPRPFSWYSLVEPGETDLWRS